MTEEDLNNARRQRLAALARQQCQQRGLTGPTGKTGLSGQVGPTGPRMSDSSFGYQVLKSEQILGFEPDNPRIPAETVETVKKDINKECDPKKIEGDYK